MADDKWYSRALPILEAVNGYEDEGRDLVSVAQIAEATDLEPQAVLAELKRLIRDGYIGDEVDEGFGGDPGAATLNHPALLGNGARAVEAWPSDDPYDAFVAVLDRRLTEETDVDQRGRLQRMRDAVLALGKDVLTGVLVELAKRPL